MYEEIHEQIQAVKNAQIKVELDLIAESHARLEAARIENEKRRIEAQENYEAKVAANEKRKKDAFAAKEELERAEKARIRAEEMKVNLAQEAKEKEEKEAEQFHQMLINLQFQHEQALKALKDSYAISITNYTTNESPRQHVIDDSEPKEVIQNTDGTKNPLSRFQQSSN